MYAIKRKQLRAHATCLPWCKKYSLCSANAVRDTFAKSREQVLRPLSLSATHTLSRPPRTFRLDASALAQARASSVLALDPSRWGGVMTLPERAPATWFSDKVENTHLVRAAMADMEDGDGPDSNGDSSEQTMLVDVPGTSVAVVSIDGPLAQRAIYDLCGYVDGYDAVSARVCEALASPYVGALVLRISSPGGDVAGLEAAVSRMRSAADASGKTVLAFVDECAASAAYWIAASVADRIYLPQSGMVGSIGCFATLVDQTEELKQAGIAVEIVRDPPGKAESHPLGPVSDLARERAQTMVSAVTARFTAAIASRRGIAAKDVTDLNGAVVEGSAAVAAHLADGINTLEGVIAMAGQEAAAKAATGAAFTGMAALAGVSAESLTEDIAKATAKSAGEAMKAAASILSLTGDTDLKAALGNIRAWKVSHESNETLRAEMAAAAKVTEQKKRVDILSSLVPRLGPLGVWAPDADGVAQAGTPNTTFVNMPIEELESFASVLNKGNVVAAKTPVKAEGGVEGLTEYERAMCERKGLDPVKYAAGIKGKRPTVATGTGVSK